jgi:hypothetical protein
MLRVVLDGCVSEDAMLPNLTNSRDFVFCKSTVLAPFSCKEK